jgi:hypothetical protein
MEKKPPLPSPLPGRGLQRDFNRLREHGGATAAELRDFVRQLKGKNTQEVLGLVAQSGLLRATVLASVATVALVLVLTLVPYAMAKFSPPEQPAAAAPSAAAATDTAAPPADAGTATDQPPAGTAGSDTATVPTVGGANQPQANDDLLDALGEGDTLESDPDNNPLEESQDDLLDDLR